MKGRAPRRGSSLVPRARRVVRLAGPAGRVVRAVKRRFFREDAGGTRRAGLVEGREDAPVSPMMMYLKRYE